MNNPFKVGDKVRRIGSDHVGMRIDDTATVKKVHGAYAVELVEYPGRLGDATHDPKYLELVPVVKSVTPAMILSTDPAERKATPITTGVIDYFPRALAEVARLSKVGNDQHNPGQPLHWDKSKSTDHADCILRHLIDRHAVDTDNHRHSTKLAWRALALLETQLEQEERDANAA